MHAGTPAPRAHAIVRRTACRAVTRSESRGPSRIALVEAVGAHEVRAQRGKFTSSRLPASRRRPRHGIGELRAQRAVHLAHDHASASARRHCVSAMSASTRFVNLGAGSVAARKAPVALECDDGSKNGRRHAVGRAEVTYSASYRSARCGRAARKPRFPAILRERKRRSVRINLDSARVRCGMSSRSGAQIPVSARKSVERRRGGVGRL